MIDFKNKSEIFAKHFFTENETALFNSTLTSELVYPDLFSKSELDRYRTHFIDRITEAESRVSSTTSKRANRIVHRIRCLQR